MLTKERFLIGLTDSYIKEAFILQYGGELETFIDYCPPERLDARLIAHLDDYFANGTTVDLAKVLEITHKVFYAFRTDAWHEYKDDSGTTYSWRAMSELYDLAQTLDYGNKYDEWLQFAEDLNVLINEGE